MEGLNGNWWSWTLRITHFEINTSSTQVPRKGEVTNLNNLHWEGGQNFCFRGSKKVLFSLLSSRVKFIWWLLSKWEAQTFIKAVPSFFPSGNVKSMYGHWQTDMQLIVLLLLMWSESGELEQREEFLAASSVSEVFLCFLGAAPKV